MLSNDCTYGQYQQWCREKQEAHQRLGNELLTSINIVFALSVAITAQHGNLIHWLLVLWMFRRLYRRAQEHFAKIQVYDELLVKKDDETEEEHIERIKCDLFRDDAK